MMKKCRVCGKFGNDELFVKKANICKDCNNTYLKKYRETHKDPVCYYDPEEIKTCSICGFVGKASEFRKGRSVCKSCKAAYSKEYLEKNAQRLVTYRKEQYVERREEFIAFQKQYRKTNKVEISARSKEKYDADPIHKLSINKKYASTPKGKAAWSKKQQIRRGLGYKPINNWFKNSDCHHLRYTFDINAKDNDIVLYVPRDLHTSIQHNGKTGKNMKAINIKLLLWYIENTPKENRNIKAVKMLENYCTMPEPSWR
ncbi:MAG: hypothetical protein M0R51_05110 [Clostridia bacterium]|jgi:hypothetical protein|nr:hypothetical protein [Clostridia bacterium]